MQQGEQPVALKIVKELTHLRSEVHARHNGGKSLDEAFVLGFVRTHVPEGCSVDSDEAWKVASEPSAPGEYVLVMPCAEANLQQAAAVERIAGNDVATVTRIIEDVARALHHLHTEARIIHGDVKPRNIVRVHNHWKLIDLDASALIILRPRCFADQRTWTKQPSVDRSQDLRFGLGAHPHSLTPAT